MKLIKLTRGQFAKVDDEDYDFLNQWKWHALKVKNDYYAARSFRDKLTKKSSYVYMHRLIMKPAKGIVVDHKDHDTLNNQKYNLRNATRFENSANMVSKTGSSSEYMGVSKKVDKYTEKGKEYVYIYWIARCSKHGKATKSYRFPYTPEGEILAAKKYDELAKEIHGEFACLNFKE